jgi:uncharacterized protein
MIKDTTGYTLNDIISLHKKYAPSDKVYELVFVHCRIVYEIAMQLIQKKDIPLDQELIRVGALLHDIGVYKVLGSDGELVEGADYIRHGLEGEKILKSEGFPKTIWRFASHHTGVGISAQDIISGKLPLPPKDYQAVSDEEMLIMYADKFHSKSTSPQFNSYDWYKRYVSRFGDQKVDKFDQMATQFGIPNLLPLSEKYAFSLRS